MSYGNNIVIRVPEMDKMDITGKLLEKYTEGTSYNTETKEWTVPSDVCTELIEERD